ncbi:methylated-DNA--protein-cysteine methyltransferase [Trapelia coarctata]|nr:methylated-DNA--protein-cysteine methyltransferase [Trapelia coarctata]
MPPSLSDLRARWTNLYTITLPHLATTHNPTQRVWPVQLDHCFACIIYDHILGESKVPWTRKLQSPAIQHMKPEQLEACIAMAEGIVAGAVDLAEMDRRSLAVRGKVRREGEREKERGKISKAKAGGKSQSDIRAAMVRLAPARAGELVRSKYFAEALPLPNSPPRSPSPPSPPSPAPLSTSHPSTTHPSLPALILATPFPNHTHRVLLALLQIPPGQFTTYGALAHFLASSPRAVGAALRKNPFAPAVPCHRVVAADGSIGGYMGEWGAGERVERKVALLRGEGVRFDGRGRAVGRVWGGWREGGGEGDGGGKGISRMEGC